MSLYTASAPQLAAMLKALDGWLDKGAESAKDRSFDPSVLLTSRLAPDQYSLLRQVQAACDAAKFAVARLAGKEAPKHPDTEQTYEEVRARIASVVAYIEGFTEADFEGASKRLIALPFLEGKVMRASDYLNQMALPNFYFHVTTAYAILRHSGVKLGKRDFIATLTLRDP